MFEQLLKGYVQSEINNNEYTKIVYSNSSSLSGAFVDVTYESDGTITGTYPSAYALTLNATTNGTYNASNGTYTQVNVNVPTGTARTSSDLTVSGDTVTVPAGLYSSQATASVASGSATTPSTLITSNPSISVNTSTGLITSTTSAYQSVTPTVSAGYVSSGIAGTVSVSGSNTSQLSTQAGTTITPTESEQTAVSAGKYTTGAVKVGAISSTYVGSGIDRRDETDLTASGSTVTVPAGFYAEQETKSVSSGTAVSVVSVIIAVLELGTATLTVEYPTTSMLVPF